MQNNTSKSCLQKYGVSRDMFKNLKEQPLSLKKSYN